MMTPAQKLLLVIITGLIVLMLLFMRTRGEAHQVRIYLPMAANGAPPMISTAWVRPSPTATTAP